MAPRELFRLLNVLDEHNIALGKGDVAWAFEPGQRNDAAEQWVREYLKSSTILTEEELKFYAKHDNETRVAVPNGRLITDVELKDAIKSLEASTTAIEQQSRVLEAQKHALQQLRSSSSYSEEASDAHESRKQRLLRQKAQLDLEVDELSESIGGRLQSSSKTADAAVSGLLAVTDDLFNRDDRILDGLQKVVTNLETTTEDTSPEEMDRLCSALASLSVRELQATVDATYAIALQTGGDQLNGHSGGHDETILEEINTVRAELKELTGEIPGLQDLFIDSHYRIPLSKNLKASQSRAAAEKVQWSEDLVSTLQYLTSRLKTLDKHFQHLHAHNDALATIVNTHRTVAAQSPATNAQQRPPSPEKQQPQKGLRPLMLLSRSQDSQDPVAQVLRQFDLRNTDTSDNTKLSTALHAAVDERKERNLSLAKTTEQSVARQLAESLAKSDRDVQALLSAVYAHSPFGTIHLVDSEAQTSIEALERKTQILGEQMRHLDSEGMAKEVRQKQKEILAQW